MDIGFILSYVVVPVIIAYGVMSGKKKTNMRRLGNMLVIKGVFYLYLAIGTTIPYFKQDFTNRYAVGLTVAIAIIEGGTALADGIAHIEQDHREKMMSKEAEND